MADFLEHATTLAQHIAAYHRTDPGSLTLPPLCPDGPVTPSQLVAVLAGHGSSFLGSAKLGREFHRPAYWNNNGAAFVKLPDTIWPDDAYRAVVFGQVHSLPYRDWNHDWFMLSCPDWSQKGWPESALLDAFTSQFSPLSETYWEDRNGDLDNSRYPVVRKWSDGLKLIVDIDSKSPLEYLLPSADGDPVSLEGIQDYTTFPFAIGDTVIAEVTLHLWEKEFSSKDHRREYSLVTRRLRFLKIAVCVSPVPSLADDITLH
ncbi:hypothetical protein B0H11DRAFT_2263410 [Mycena galericulata]|nr:hypothetical protein B0H11DRAFT_2263410 [Mycena galericulata]